MSVVKGNSIGSQRSAGTATSRTNLDDDRIEGAPTQIQASDSKPDNDVREAGPLDEQRLQNAEKIADEVMMTRWWDRFYQPTQDQLNAVYDAKMVWVDYSLGRYGLMSRVEYQSYTSVALAKAELLRRKTVAEGDSRASKGRSGFRCCIIS